MTATRISNGSTGKAVLHLAFELGTGKWKLGFMVGHGEKPRLRDIPAGDLASLRQEIAKAKQHFGLFGSEEGREWAVPCADYKPGTRSPKGS